MHGLDSTRLNESRINLPRCLTTVQQRTGRGLLEISTLSAGKVMQRNLPQYKNPSKMEGYSSREILACVLRHNSRNTFLEGGM